MKTKHILIVDDEIAILEVLRSSLKKLGDEYQVETVTDGYKALEKLNQQNYDLVVTDYKMVGINGLELLEAIQAIQPETRVIMMTAYGNETLEAEARELKAHDFLHKPLEISAFRKIVRESLADAAINRPGILILSDNRYRQVSQILEQLQGDIGARCTLLVDASGQMIARTGDAQDLPIEAIASLLGGGIATITEAGRALDGDEDAINLAYREGKDINFYAINIGQHLLMILILEQNPYSSKLGSVWYYAQRSAKELTRTMGENDFTPTANFLDQDSIENFDKEFDNLFDLGENLDEAASPEAPAPPNMADVLPISDVISASQKKPAFPKEEPRPHLFSFDEAVQRGLIPSDLGKSKKPAYGELQ